MSVERAEPVAGGSLVQLQRDLYEQVTWLCRALSDPDDQEAREWVVSRAALGRPNEAIEQIVAEMQENSRRARRLTGVPIDAHADRRKEREEMYRQAEKAGRLKHWRLED